MFVGAWAKSQTPSTYPYFNRIHIASDSTHPSFYHFYAGGQRISEDTILLLGHQFWGGNDQIYQRTLEFIDVRTGDLLDKIIEPNVALMGIENPPFSSGIVGNQFVDLGMQNNVVRTFRKYTNVNQGISTEFELDAHPSVMDADWYSHFSIKKNGDIICYGRTPNSNALISIYNPNGTLTYSTDLSHIIPHIPTNHGTIYHAQQLLNNSFLIQIRTNTNIASSVGQFFLLKEDFTWQKQLFLLNQNITANTFQHSDSSLYFFGLKDSSVSISNAQVVSYIKKFNQEGDLIWENYYPIQNLNLQDQAKPHASNIWGGLGLESGNILFFGNDIFKGADGDYQQMDGEQSLQTRLLCITPDGEKIWERSFHTSTNNSSLGIGFIPLANDDIIIYGGIIEDFFFYEKAFVSKVNCIGRMTDLMHDVHANEQDGLVSIQIEADSFYETTIDWGDGSTSTNFQTAYSDSSELFLAQHLYAQSQPYQITVSTRGCKDTLVYELVQEAHVPDNNAAELSMFPNPTLGFFKIKIPTNEVLNLEVTDAFGKLVYQFKDVSLFNGFDVDLTMQPVGQYHIRITGKARSWVGKVIKI
jgi:hypothetical protein